MHRHLTLLILLIQVLPGSSQNTQLIDSLNQLTKSAKNDSLKLEYHYELCYQWAAYSFDSSYYHASKMVEISNNSQDPIFQFKSLSAIGLVYDYQYEFDSAIHYYSSARSYAHEIDYPKGIAIATFNIGVVHYYSGEMEKAIDNYLQAEKVYLKLNDQRNLSVLYNNMGLIYRKTKKYKLAVDTYQKSLEIKRQNEDVSGILNTLTNLSSVYQLQGDLDRASEASEEVIFIAKEIGDQGAYLSELINLGKIYTAKSENDEALTLFQEAEAILPSEADFNFKIDIYHHLSRFYLDRQEFSIAKKYLDFVEEILDPEKQMNLAMNHYLAQSEYYHKKSNSSQAYDALNKAFEIREKIFDNNILEKTTELEQTYEKDKRELEIERLNTENQLANLSIAQKNQERNGLILFLILGLGLAVLFFILFRQKRNSLNEREILLKEIHHRVKNNLQIISSLLNLQAGSLEDEVAKDAVKEGQNRVKSMALIHENLYQNENLSGISVDDYINNLVRTLFNSYGVDDDKIKTELNVEKLQLDIDTLIPLGLILNELLSNSLKYAFPQGEGQLELKLNKSSDCLNLKLKDNGPGMDERNLESSNSYGWKMIKSLSRKLKAELEIHNNQGTIITLKIRNYKLVA